jgi:hypothetical protein
MRETKLFNSDTILSSSKYGNSFMYEQEQQIQKRRIKKLQWFFVLLLVLGYFAAALAQTGLNDINLNAESVLNLLLRMQ